MWIASTVPLFFFFFSMSALLIHLSRLLLLSNAPYPWPPDTARWTRATHSVTKRCFQKRKKRRYRIQQWKTTTCFLVSTFQKFKKKKVDVNLDSFSIFLDNMNKKKEIYLYHLQSYIPPMAYYWTGLQILDHSCLVGNLTNSKIAETKALEPLKPWHFCISNFRICWFLNETWVVQD